jgi:hypothetical protein
LLGVGFFGSVSVYTQYFFLTIPCSMMRGLCGTVICMHIQGINY